MEEKKKLINQRTKISVVIPTFNSEKTLGRLLDSIKRQTYTNIEIVIIDGVSSDNTQFVVDQYKDVVSSYISEPDEGIYDAINKGIKHSSGDLIVIAGSDDYFCNDTVFEKISSSYNNEKFDMYAGRTIFKNKDGSDSYREDASYGIESLVDGIPVGHNAMFVQRNTYIDVGLYDTSYNICGDAQWVHRAIKKGKNLHYLDIDVINFSMSGTSSNNDIAIMEETYRVIRENFPILSREDAACIFKCYRGWQPRQLVIPLLKKYKNHMELTNTLSKAFPEYSESFRFGWRQRLKHALFKIINKLR
ncbi:glycosyltransferase [Vibrio fluvialis]|nr:glycosyltransferase [Vibrio fluvialis]